jgi:hypothetical protein
VLVAASVLFVCFDFLSSRMAVQVAKTSNHICAKEQSRLIVALFESGHLLDPDFEPVVELSRQVLSEMQEMENK